MSRNSPLFHAWMTCVVLPLALSACATAPVLHTEMQLNDVGTRCGFALGEKIVGAMK